MSYQTAAEPTCTSVPGTVELVIEAKAKDLGGFSVRRVLPSSRRRMVGPFIFFDHMGPAEFPPGQGIQVRPHPHIGLATVTYLFEGEIMHRDSLGFVQPIQAGAVNLMTAGRGIVHSERAGSDLERMSRLHGIQSWMALPTDLEETGPDFVHYPAQDLPQLEQDGLQVRVIIGEAYGVRSPVKSYSPMLYLECRANQGSTLTLPEIYDEQAIYVVSGDVGIGEQKLGSGVMAVVAPGEPAEVTANADSRIMVIGGAPLGPRHIWWNFVSSSRERIEQAKVDWQQSRFTTVPGDDEFIPLPD
ncbi:MAG: pirin family protein [Betaproteobacteria bacterium]|nr:MAG: pirin family protein [Betaproteobacteria bacterium]